LRRKRPRRIDADPSAFLQDRRAIEEGRIESLSGLGAIRQLARKLSKVRAENLQHALGIGGEFWALGRH